MINRRTVLNVLAGVGSAMGAGSVLGAPLYAEPFAQTKTWSCWAAAAVILLEWKNKIPISELQIAQMAGPSFEAAFNNNTGLSGTKFSDFAMALHFKTEAPENFTPTGYHDLLKAHGPLLWVGSRLDVGTATSRRHIRVLRGRRRGPNRINRLGTRSRRWQGLSFDHVEIFDETGADRKEGNRRGS